VPAFLNSKIVGSLGLLVLLSSLIKQSFHPEVDEADARRKALHIEGLILAAGNELAILESKIKGGEDQSDSLSALLRDTSKQLTAIKMAESIKPAPTLEKNDESKGG
jgi:hypothetical protein